MQLLLDDPDAYDLSPGPFAYFLATVGQAPNPCRKFHISAAPGSAARVAAIALPFLRERRISHKCVWTLERYAQLNKGNSRGKFITVYQRVEQSPAVVTHMLGGMLRAAAEAEGLEPYERIPTSRPHHHVFIETPWFESGLFVYGGAIVDPSA